MKVIETSGAPKAVGPYVQAIEAGGLLFVSGQIPINSETGKIEGETTPDQARRVLKNLQAVVAASSTTWSNVVKVTVYMKDLRAFDALNQVYSEFFPSAKPVRACVEVARLPKDVLVEMDLIAVL